MYCILTQKHEYTNLVDINRWEHILEHGGHQFKVHIVTTEIIHDKKGMVLELLLFQVWSFERCNDISG